MSIPAIRLLLLPLVLSWLPAKANPEETFLWKNVAGWNVYIDKTLKFQCFITNLYEDNTFFRISFLEPGSSSALYVAIGNPDWTSIEVDKDYDLTLQIDNAGAWRSPSRGARIGTIPSLLINTSQADFVESLMRKHSLKVHFNSRQILHLSLRGSNAALMEMLNCQDTVNSYREKASPKDPFSGASSPSLKKDPFAL